MSMNLKIGFVLLALMSQTAWAVKPEAGYIMCGESDLSPNGDLVIENYHNEKLNENSRQVWISERAHPENRALLFQHDHNVDVVFSPDEDQLVVNNHTGSSETRIHLFKRKSGVKYEEVEAPDLNDLLWHFFMQVNAPESNHTGHYTMYRGNSLTPFDHNYLECRGWSADGSAILVQFTGHVGSHDHIDNAWYCVLDLKTMKPSFDLRMMNRQAVMLGGKIRAGGADTNQNKKATRQGGTGNERPNGRKTNKPARRQKTPGIADSVKEKTSSTSTKID